MNKKTLLLTLTAGCTALGVTTITLSNSGVFALFAGSGEPRTHTIYFNKDNTVVNLGTFNDSYYSYPISFSQNNAIVISDTQKYNLNSYNNIDYTRIYGAEDSFSTTGSSMLSFVADYNYLSITFALQGAELDESESLVGFTHNGAYISSYIFDFIDYDGDINYYQATVSFSSYWNEQIELTTIKLVFTCDA